MKPNEVRQRVAQLFPVYGSADDPLGRMIFDVLCLAYLEGKLDQASEDMTNELKRMRA